MLPQLSVAVVIIYVLGLTILTFSLSILVIKSRNNRIERNTEQCVQRFQDYFTYIQAHIDSNEKLKPPHGSLSKLERRVLQKKLVEWLENFAGSDRAKIVALCEDTGLIQYHLKRLHSPLPWVRIDAAYYLGAMRSEAAVPKLLEMLDTRKFDSGLFIVARAVAKCARELKDLREMLLMMSRHKKGFHYLINDILKESDLDCAPLLMQCLDEKDNEVVKSALVGWSAPITSVIASTLYRLTNSEDKEIRIKASKLLTSENISFPSEIMEALIRHYDWEIRLTAARAIGVFGLKEHIGLLKEAINDSHWAVRYQTEQSMASLQQKSSSSESMREKSFDAETISALIREEMEKGTVDLADIEPIIQYQNNVNKNQQTTEKKRYFQAV